MKRRVSMRRYKINSDGSRELIFSAIVPSTTKALQLSLSSIDSQSSMLSVNLKTKPSVLDATNFCDDYITEESKFGDFSGKHKKAKLGYDGS